MAILSYFFDAETAPDGSLDREYTADDFSNYLASIVGDGVFPNPSTNLEPYAAGSDSRQVYVSAGEAWVQGRKMRLTTTEIFQVDAGDVLYDRIDRLVFYLDKEARGFGMEILKGEPSSDPLPPDLTRDNYRYDMCLAEIHVAAQAIVILAEDITDTRADSTICGWVAGLIQQVDTSTLFNQWASAYNRQYAAFLEQTRDFMQTLTTDLRVNTYLTKFQGDYDLAYGHSSDILLTYTGYEYSPTDIIEVYINGLLAVNLVDYQLILAIGNIPAVRLLRLTGVAGQTEHVTIKVLKTTIGIMQLVDNQGSVLVDQYGNPIIAGN